MNITQIDELVKANSNIEYKLTEVMGTQLCIFYNGNIGRWIKDPHPLPPKYMGIWRQVVDSANQKGIKINNKMISKAALVANAFLNFDIECLDEFILYLDGNKSNNHVDNLKIVEHKQLLQLSNYKNAKGCSFNKKAKLWEAKIRINGEQNNLGYYKEEEDARKAYLDAKTKYYNL